MLTAILGLAFRASKMIFCVGSWHVQLNQGLSCYWHCWSMNHVVQIHNAETWQWQVTDKAEQVIWDSNNCLGYVKVTDHPVICKFLLFQALLASRANTMNTAPSLTWVGGIKDFLYLNSASSISPSLLLSTGSIYDLRYSFKKNSILQYSWYWLFFSL